MTHGRNTNVVSNDGAELGPRKRQKLVGDSGYACGLIKGTKDRNSIALIFPFRLFSNSAPQRGLSSASSLPIPYETKWRNTKEAIKLRVTSSLSQLRGLTAARKDPLIIQMLQHFLD